MKPLCNYSYWFQCSYSCNYCKQDLAQSLWNLGTELAENMELLIQLHFPFIIPLIEREESDWINELAIVERGYFELETSKNICHYDTMCVWCKSATTKPHQAESIRKFKTPPESSFSLKTELQSFSYMKEK